ncbi:xyloglucan-specific galacturonosyltransferase 1-like [Rutidosis leptorrhynchoides]|uniref:xyloglucan-specific galacturonosyltransferase 1-like n=1 Tax=Rutidosis leptorrhynchoides TaxID=125765 RepID=UPI003A9937FF
MLTVSSKRKSKVAKKVVESQSGGCLRSCVAWFVFPLPAALFFMILMFVWSSSTTYISGRIVHVCVSSRKLSNLYCLSATTQPNEEFRLPFTNSSSEKFLGNRNIPLLEEKLEKEKNEFLDSVSNDNNHNLKDDSKLLVEVKNGLKDEPKMIIKPVIESPTIVEKATVFHENKDENEGSDVFGDLKAIDTKKVSSPEEDRINEIKKAKIVVEEQLRVHRSWTTSQNWNQNQNQCEGRGVYVYELPPKFNKDLVAQCHDMVPWVDMCKYFGNNALGEPIPELGSRWFRTHQYSLELIFHNRVLNHPCRVYDENQAKLFYVPYYGGLDILRWHFKKVSSEVKDLLALELVNWLEMQKPWDKNLGKDHVFVLGKISWDFRRKDNTSWGTKFLELEEMKNPIKLMIERQPWEINDIGIPHPTHFHPQSDDDIRSWQRTIISSNRRNLVSFAGAARPGSQDNIRSILIDQCISTTKETCKFFDCKSGLCDEPKSLIGLFTESEFCLQPPGDSPTRKSVFDSLVAGCIPVVFDPFTAYYQYPWHLPEDHSKYSVLIDQEEVRNLKVNVVEKLMNVSLKERDEMRRYIVYELMPKLVYGDQDAKFSMFQDAFSITINNLLERVKALNLE